MTAATLNSFVAKRIETLYQGSRNGGTAAGTLAALRRNSTPGSNPATWEATLGLPPELAGRGSTASAHETAAHAALSLWAHHQQSKSNRMHQSGRSFASALRTLMNTPGVSEQAVDRRFKALAMSRDIAAAATHARGLIGQLRDQQIAVDYGELAVHLSRFQQPSTRNQVVLAWGREFSRKSPTTRPTETTVTEPEAA